MVAVHISKHSLFRLKITVGCRLCTCPSIHFSLDEDTLKITVGCLVWWCGVVCGVVCVCVVCCGGVLWWVCCGGVCVVVLWWCVCVWCVVKLGTLSLSCSLSFLFSFPLFFSYLSFSLFFFLFFFSCSFSYSCSCSCSFSFSSFFFLPFYSLFSSLPFTPTNTVQSTDQQTRRPNFEAFECDVAHGTFIATANELHGVFPPLLLPPLLSSLLPPSHTQKKERDFLLQEYFRRGNYFVLQFYINAEKINAGENYRHCSFILIRKH